jgi:hypothetical protein
MREAVEGSLRRQRAESSRNASGMWPRSTAEEAWSVAVRPLRGGWPYLALSVSERREGGHGERGCSRRDGRAGTEGADAAGEDDGATGKGGRPVVEARSSREESGSKDDIRVDVEDDALVIHGERRQEREVEGSGTYRAERFHGNFRRVIPLPTRVDPEAVQASFENGVLEVSLRLPAEKARGKRIEIREGKQGSVH